jgi:hypothetical protein
MESAGRTRGQRAVQVKPLESGNIRHSNSAEIRLFASASSTHGHPASEDLVRREMKPRNRELTARATRL